MKGCTDKQKKYNLPSVYTRMNISNFTVPYKKKNVLYSSLHAL